MKRRGLGKEDEGEDSNPGYGLRSLPAVDSERGEGHSRARRRSGDRKGDGDQRDSRVSDPDDSGTGHQWQGEIGWPRTVSGRDSRDADLCALLDAFGIAGAVEGTSDVAVAGRKISGNAQARRWRSLLVHGTLLVDFDFDLAEKVLPHPLREPEYRRARRHRDFLVTLRALGVQADRETIQNVALQVGRRLFQHGSTPGAPEKHSLHGYFLAALQESFAGSPAPQGGAL